MIASYLIQALHLSLDVHQAGVRCHLLHIGLDIDVPNTSSQDIHTVQAGPHLKLPPPRRFKPSITIF